MLTGGEWNLIDKFLDDGVEATSTDVLHGTVHLCGDGGDSMDSLVRKLEIDLTIRIDMSRFKIQDSILDRPDD